MGAIHEFVSREVLCDGHFIYNAGYQLKLVNNHVKKCYYDAVLTGVITDTDCVELPEYFSGKKLSCINPIKVYKKGNKFSLGNAPFVAIPLSQRPKHWYSFDKTSPDSQWIYEVPNCINSLIFSNVPIKDRAFANSVLKTISFKKSPLIITEKCFSNSINLKNCNLANGIKKIGFSAFEGCTSLHYIHLPSTITNICERAFYSTGLKAIIIPDKVTRIKKETFGKCQNLQTVIIPPSVNFIHPLAFKDSPQVKIVAVKHSYAQSYAFCNGFTFIPLEDVIKFSSEKFHI